METVLYKHRDGKKYKRERTVKGKCLIESLARVMRGRKVSMEIQSLRNSIIMPTLTYGSETGHGIGHSS